MNQNIYQKKLGDRTMRHVYGIWFVRKVLPGLALEAGALAIFVLFAQGFIKWGHLINNVIYRWTHHPIARMDDFWLEAIRNTELITQLLLLAALTVASLFVKDAVRATRNFFIQHRVSI